MDFRDRAHLDIVPFVFVPAITGAQGGNQIALADVKSVESVKLADDVGALNLQEIEQIRSQAGHQD